MRRVVLVVLALVACSYDKAVDERPPVEECVCDSEKMGPWILQCIEKATPASSVEDPEDWIEECESVAIKIHCGPGCYLASGGAYLRRTEFKPAESPPASMPEVEFQ